MHCPNCGETVSDTQTTCNHCGQELSLAEPTLKRGRRRFRPWIAAVLGATLLVTAAGALFWRFGLAKAQPGGRPAADEAIAAAAPAEPGIDRPAQERRQTLEEGISTRPPSLIDQVQPQGGYPLPASFGDLGPRLLEAGAIDYDRFAQLYLRNGQSLSDLQVAILKEGSDSQVVIDADNAYFLLNFFWAVGLTNRNRILEEGAMMERGADRVGNFASTGGWTLGTKPSTELYSSTPLIVLTEEQQVLVEEVSSAIYRPCCGNPTSFPDCNHGMAFLGLLELMASQGATVEEMFSAAKYVNAFWFPQQTLEVALYFQAREGVDFAKLDARRAFGAEFFSAAGYGGLHQWLAENSLLQQIPNQGGSCGV